MTTASTYKPPVLRFYISVLLHMRGNIHRDSREFRCYASPSVVSVVCFSYRSPCTWFLRAHSTLQQHIWASGTSVFTIVFYSMRGNTHRDNREFRCRHVFPPVRYSLVSSAVLHTLSFSEHTPHDNSTYIWASGTSGFSVLLCAGQYASDIGEFRWYTSPPVIFVCFFCRSPCTWFLRQQRIKASGTSVLTIVL